MDGQSTGTHHTNQEFSDQLAAWGFAPRKEDGPHTVYRGPHGGTVRVIRSRLGRADPARVAKAARLARVTTEQFWAGPSQAAGQDHRASRSPRRRSAATRDRVTSLVLGIHAAADRPLGFDQVVNLAGGRVIRAQVRTASAQLCREGDLDRIRSGVYQWSAGARALRPAAAPAAPAPEPRTVRPSAPEPAGTAPATSPSTARASAAELFGQLFPGGVRMTADVLADFEQWAELTERLITHATPT
jgi:hypothetical protein